MPQYRLQRAVEEKGRFRKGNAMYEKVNPDLNFVEREHETSRFWKENHIFEKSIEEREGCPTYMFYDGPPTANGKPHIGHVLTRCIKDMIPRYHAMKGCCVPRKAGWDTHGLPVELEVEKEIGISGKDQIEQYGIEPFIKKCKESVWTYKGMWEKFSDAVGFWADMDNPYVTYYDDYIESEWWGPADDLEQRTSLQGLQGRALLPALRDAAFLSRGGAGIQDRKGTLRRRPFQGQR
jgi:isoleucyl-tRNA synthetase